MEPHTRVGKDGLEAARRIRRLREHRGMTIRQMAEALTTVGRPILPSGIVKLEQGERRIDVDDLTALAAALEVQPNAFISGDFGTFDELDRELVDLDRILSRPELKAVVEAVNDALAARISLDAIQSSVKAAKFMHKMSEGGR